MEEQEIVRWLKRHDEAIQMLQVQSSDFRVSQAKIELQVDTIAKAVADIIVKIDRVLEQPRKRWDTVITSLLSAMISAGVAYLSVKVLS